jgi:hypothetical protein
MQTPCLHMGMPLGMGIYMDMSMHARRHIQACRQPFQASEVAVRGPILSCCSHGARAPHVAHSPYHVYLIRVGEAKRAAGTKWGRGQHIGEGKAAVMAAAEAALQQCAAVRQRGRVRRTGSALRRTRRPSSKGHSPGWRESRSADDRWGVQWRRPPEKRSAIGRCTEATV